jgi:uncharacterized membrane protein
VSVPFKSVHRRSVALAAAGAVAFAFAVGTAAAGASAAYPNCKALNAKYPHGVGLAGARDKTTGEPVTTFKRSNTLYRLNVGKDRDKDGIACEKR